LAKAVDGEFGGHELLKLSRIAGDGVDEGGEGKESDDDECQSPAGDWARVAEEGAENEEQAGYE